MKSTVRRMIDFFNNLIDKLSISAIDLDSLLIQQHSLKKNWDNPEEDIYQLNERNN